MAKGGPQGGKDKYDDAPDAKELLDRIGKDVHDQVQTDAKTYFSELKGDLSKASYPNDENSEGSTENNPCKLQYDYNTNVTEGHGKEYPCANRSDIRFSDKQGAECDKSKIKDNKGKSEGACAPYRRSSLCDHHLSYMNAGKTNTTDNLLLRSSLCDHHLSYMNAGKTNTTDNLLLEVCLAALHEGDSLKHYSEKLNVTYTDSPSQLCTELARSFADIGDIIRGKDLYLGDKGEKKKLDDKLKEIFENIRKENNSKLKSLTDDQIREYWWTANRHTVWEAITCDVHGSDYFRHTCNGQNKTESNCRCAAGDVPTYFDYVPQFLRWFEEWAEDFCRKKKKNIEIVKNFCRGVYEGKERYCDRNGFDCERDSSLCEPWKCYKEDDIEKHVEHVLGYHKEVKGAGGLCILENKNKTSDNDPEEFQKTFNDFFYFWVGRLLNDSIEWREKLGKCLENGTKTRCKNNKKCNRECGCFLKWIGQKKDEWGKIKVHFGKQDFGEGKLFGPFPPYYVIETVLEDSFLDDITKAYGDARAIQGIKNMLAKKKEEQNANTSNQKTIIDYLLDHEKKEAQECLRKHQEKCPEDTAGESRGRSADPSPGIPPAPRPATTAATVESSTVEEDEEDEDEDDDDVDEGEEGETAKDTTEELPEVKKEEVKVCETVAEALKGNLDYIYIFQHNTIIIILPYYNTPIT
ncbi:hypothetical protein PFTANZ_05819 [Plasmodium falciparum Tanzania (2000708)]|uniref:Duffy-binding-like domain-containing protein n=1 Tax=Plasmodium falciparum Tanzania (2000708) TaxID=1036725 RepID=A0A024VXR9_PLAFA|nr:hypothetical protein PFTANZ_05819 [Plasmodium falciparum Tanzania (2000708)]